MIMELRNAVVGRMRRSFDKIPTDLDIFFVQMLICLSKIRLASIVTPKYFTNSLMETRLLCKNTSISGIMLVVLGGIIKTEYFWGLIVILLALVRSSRFSNS